MDWPSISTIKSLTKKRLEGWNAGSPQKHLYNSSVPTVYHKTIAGLLYLNDFWDTSFFFCSLCKISPEHLPLPSSPLTIWNRLRPQQFLDTMTTEATLREWLGPTKRRPLLPGRRSSACCHWQRPWMLCSKWMQLQHEAALHLQDPPSRSIYGKAWPVSMGLHLMIEWQQEVPLSLISPEFTAPYQSTHSYFQFQDQQTSPTPFPSTGRAQLWKDYLCQAGRSAISPFYHLSATARRTLSWHTGEKEGNVIQGTETMAVLSIVSTRNPTDLWF